MNKNALPLFYEAIGWTFAQCCQWLDEGKDPRMEECGQLVEMAEKAFRKELESDVESLKRELLAATNPILHPHIKGVYAAWLAKNGRDIEGYQPEYSLTTNPPGEE